MTELAHRLGFGGRSRRIGTGVSVPVVLILIAAAIFLLVGSLVSPIFAQQTVAGLAQGAIFASLALALVLIYRATEVVNFAQGEMAMATTYFAYQLTLWHLSYWAAFFLALLMGFLLGVVVQVVLIRPVQHSVIAVVIVTVGLFVLIDGLVTWKWGADLKFMPAPFGNQVYHVGSVAFSRQDLGTLVVTIVSVVLLWVLFRFTKLGLAMRAAALRPASAALVGVRVNRMLAIGWGLAAVLGAVAGLMTEPTVFLQPTMMQAVLLYAFAAAVLGGLESPAGAVVGGLALGVFLNLIGQYVGFATSELRLPIAFFVLLVVLLVKPHGLFGRKQVRRV
ncbi:MAG TPA: branched-chain amino acid ABC transporter permease [Gaiellaceae bacterium]|nr:branched-chain amino acid ABC transporter permease [Gaiellaceae bacterium]